MPLSDARLASGQVIKHASGLKAQTALAASAFAAHGQAHRQLVWCFVGSVAHQISGSSGSHKVSAELHSQRHTPLWRSRLLLSTSYAGPSQILVPSGIPLLPWRPIWGCPKLGVPYFVNPHIVLGGIQKGTMTWEAALMETRFGTSSSPVH